MQRVLLQAGNGEIPLSKAGSSHRTIGIRGHTKASKPQEEPPPAPPTIAQGAFSSKRTSGTRGWVLLPELSHVQPEAQGKGNSPRNHDSPPCSIQLQEVHALGFQYPDRDLLPFQTAMRILQSTRLE